MSEMTLQVSTVHLPMFCQCLLLATFWTTWWQVSRQICLSPSERRGNGRRMTVNTAATLILLLALCRWIGMCTMLHCVRFRSHFFYLTQVVELVLTACWAPGNGSAAESGPNHERTISLEAIIFWFKFGEGRSKAGIFPEPGPGFEWGTVTKWCDVTFSSHFVTFQVRCDAARIRKSFC